MFFLHERCLNKQHTQEWLCGVAVQQYVGSIVGDHFAVFCAFLPLLTMFAGLIMRSFWRLTNGLDYSRCGISAGSDQQALKEAGLDIGKSRQVILG
ncbi:MAG: hypothetical protein AAF922_14190 [Pseudomonadota bacterium]